MVLTFKHGFPKIKKVYGHDIYQYKVGRDNVGW